MTDNHDYETPRKGATDWHVPLNDNFARLDADVEIRDVEANRTEYDPKPGSKYFATDSGAVFVGDGERWTHVGSIRKLPGDIHVQAQAPSDPSEGDLWIDTSPE
jgi:hypothetical protein